MAADLGREIEAVARQLYGEPNKRLSGKTELRFGSNGSLSVDIKGGRWYDHEHGCGGNVLELVRHRLGESCDAAAWCREHGYLPIMDHPSRRTTAEPRPRPSSSSSSSSKPNGSAGHHAEPVATYVYRDADGEPRYRVARYEWAAEGKRNKTFRQERYEPETKRYIRSKGCMEGVELVPYRLDEWQAEIGAPIAIVEGEKDADRLWSIGICATTNPGGAGKWHGEEWAEMFAGREVVILPDDDEAGRKHAADVARSLRPVASSVRLLELQDLPAKGDVSDWLDAGGQVERLERMLREAPQLDDATVARLGEGKEPRKPCSLPALDWFRVQHEEPPPERWLIEDWLPVNTAGVLAGPGSSGKSYLELIRMICLASGQEFLGYAVEQTNCLGYFAEDRMERIWQRVKSICRALQIDPQSLAGRLEIVSTVGCRRVLFESDRFAATVTPHEWLEQVRDRAVRLRARYTVFDHVGRLAAINRNDPGQVFDMFAHLDSLASSIDGCVSMLTHPSKADLAAGRKDNAAPQVGGSIAMIDAPRWVHVLRRIKPEDGGDSYRALSSAKANYREPFAIKLVENEHGIVENVGDLDPDSLEAAHGRPRASHARTLEALRCLFSLSHREITLDELVSECIRSEIVKPAEPGTAAWRDKRRTIKNHLERYKRVVDFRDNDCFAIKP